MPEAERDRMRELGEAVYEGNRAATTELKKQVKELDDVIEAKEEEMSKVATEAQERIGRPQILGGESEPAPVPEPFPPPDEGQPPEPARLPEPFPPPDEGERPEQPTIPEPGPV